ncbi:ABC transporter ATP-binding protein [Streptomyces hoynatensis]|uniref:ATP-binding cassette domain-containing protein n=1 Tax=Streptomyces hoynatensis TaxID=1141874 RepID=A0A3A9YKL3_9ACTN|nr:ATP-binding cassette domain-containing protein [Streptomyces hoynatensis]RKN35814.1 ATP-binding cassette domain-containing protein [Streptomyces hoynatensis]
MSSVGAGAVRARTGPGDRRDTASAAGEGHLEVVGLTKRFGDRVALDGVSFSVPRGTITGFVGNNGSGKTTSLRIITGLLEPDAGTVLVGGRPVTDAFRAAIGYMPEARGLYRDMKVTRQLVYLARLYGMSKAEAEREVAAWTARLGIERYRSAKLKTLSLGNQQRVQLIAALLNHPGLLILDEPFSGLDRAAAASMSEILREAAGRGVGVFFSSHQLDLVDSICERAVILRRGTVVAEGRVDELRDRGSATIRVTFGARRAPTAQELSAAMPGARLLHGTTFAVPAGADDAGRVLRAALGLGEVTEFSRRRQTLGDVFAEVSDETGAK